MVPCCPDAECPSQLEAGCSVIIGSTSVAHALIVRDSSTADNTLTPQREPLPVHCGLRTTPRRIGEHELQ